MRSSHVALAAALAAALAMACNALLGLDELTPFDPAEAGAGSSGTTSSSGDTDGSLADAAPDVITDGGGGTVGDAGVAPCDPNDVPDTTIGIFVKAEGPAGDGRMNSPFNSIAAAIAKLTPDDGGADPLADAGDGGTMKTQTIYVYGGSYGESANLAINGVRRFRIDGAWKGPLVQWVRDCSVTRRGDTVINSSKARGLVVRNVAGPSMISNLSLFTAGDTNDGISRIALQVIDSGVLTLSNTIVIAENAGTGAPASPGGAANKTCPDGASTAGCVDTPANGQPGGDGAHGSEGKFNAQLGYAPASGAPGENGTNGEMGKPGPAQSMMCADTCTESAVPACAPVTLVEHHGNPGTCGCGGGAGLGGGGGSGGGASVAILTNGIVNVEYSILQSKNGGPGMPGAVGNDGTNGTTPAPGTPGLPCNLTCCLDEAADPQTCVGADDPAAPLACRAEPTPVLGGTATPGGNGGKGGRGGNGGGGPSYTVVLLPGGQATFAQTSRSYGVGGLGSAPAPNGESGPLLQLSAPPDADAGN